MDKLSDIEALRCDIAAFRRAMGLERYLHGSGQKDKLEISPIFERYGHLFGKELARNTLERWQTAETPEEARSFKHFHQFAFFGCIGNLTKEIDEKLAARQSELEVTVRGENIGYRSIAPRLANEPDREIRREIDNAQAEMEIELNELRNESWRITHDFFRDFGFPSYREGCRRISEVDLDALSVALTAFLETSEERYIELIDKLSIERLGMPISEAGKCDIAFLLRGQNWDNLFPKEGMVEKATAFLDSLGMPLGETPSIKSDNVIREKKSPRAFCSLVKVGLEIYMCTRPSGGMGDYLTFLHELGHAYHFAFTNPELPAELAYSGDSATSEVFAFNFNYLGMDPLWLSAYVGIEDAKPIVEFLRLQKLYMMRRYSAKFLYELELHKDYHMGGRAELYSKFLTDALIAQHRWEYWLTDLDDAFYSAGYLRAWIFEMQMRDHMMSEFGADWWRDPAAGERLREYWSTGRKYMPEEMASLYFGEALDMGPITEELAR
jgi:hypothetical protein